MYAFELANQGELNLAEVKIFGSSGPPPVPSIPIAPTGLVAQANYIRKCAIELDRQCIQ